MADAIASSFNVFSGTFIGPSGVAQIEITTIEWLRELFRFPKDAGGLFVSGGSMANMTGLAVARHVMLAGNTMNATVYFSDQTHSSVAKGLKILGFQRFLDSQNRLRFYLPPLGGGAAPTDRGRSRSRAGAILRGGERWNHQCRCR